MSRKALCIEPSTAFGTELIAMLAGKGWDAEICGDLRQAETLLADGQVDLVATAASLPGGDYGEVVRRLRGRDDTANLPVILLAERRDGDLVGEAFEKGVAEIFFRDDLAPFQTYLGAFGENGDGIFLAGMRVLVLDADLLSARYVRDALSEHGMQVDSASSVEEGIGMAEAVCYDLFVVDRVLKEGQSGTQFVQRMRQSNGYGADTPVIAISSFCDVTSRLEALRAGAHVFLHKPVDGFELSFHANRLLGPPSFDAAADDELAVAVRRFGLSKRERAICAQVLAGHPDKRIADRLQISFWTVRTHLAHVFRKCGVVNRIELANCLRDGQYRAGAEKLPAFLPGSAWPILCGQVLGAFRHGVMVVGRDMSILYVNDGFTRITGYDASEILGRTPRFLSSRQHGAAFYRTMFEKLAEDGVWHGEILNRHKDGAVYAQCLDIREIEDDRCGEARYVAVYLNAAEYGLAADRLRHAALHDGMTGLANRLLLQDRGAQEIARARRSGRELAVAFIDLDDFKTVNDTQGHRGGDALLTEIAGRLRATLRDADTLARVGGDEFVALLPDLHGKAGSIALAEKLLGALVEPVKVNGFECQVGASIGISIFPAHGDGLDKLIDQADAAMYRAKGAGGNCVCFYGE